jgi:diguanylate cyclase (GGDEF)-like protein
VVAAARPRLAENHLTLIVQDDETPFRIVPVREREVVVGRAEDAGIQVRDMGVSRVHARFMLYEGVWHVEDAGSQNGTRVGEERVVGRRRIESGDRIFIGRGSSIRVLLEDETAQAAAVQLYRAATRDPLTQTFNRQYLETRLAQELAYARRHGTTLTVLMLDLDHFKEINDTHGHLAGDQLLRLVGAALNDNVREEDVVARYGGEEFMVVARGIDHRGAIVLAERLRAALSVARLQWESGLIELSVSIGAATHDDAHRYATVDDLIGAADAGLYEAKISGRDRVAVVGRRV